MKMKKEIKLEVHEAHGYKLKIQFNHLEPMYLNLNWIELSSRFEYRITTKCKLSVPNLRLRYKNTT